MFHQKKVSSVFFIFGCLLFVLLPFSSCVENRMTLSKAKSVSISMSGKAFVPPPRRADDILLILNQPSAESGEIQKARALMQEETPNTNDRASLAMFYLRRGEAASLLGRYDAFLSDLTLALNNAEEDGKIFTSKMDYAKILMLLANAESDVGSIQRAVRLLEKGLQVYPLTTMYYLLAWKYILVGDLENAQRMTDQGVDFCNQVMNRWSGRGRFWAEVDKLRLVAGMMEAKGLLKESEADRREVVDLLESGIRRQYGSSKAALFHRYRLALNLAFQNRLVEAEYEIRKALKGAVAAGGTQSALVGEIAVHYGYILLLQERFQEAGKIIGTAVDMFQATGFSEKTQIRLDANRYLGQAYLLQHRFQEASTWFRKAVPDRGDALSYGRGIARSPDVILTQVKTGASDEASKIIEEVLEDHRRVFGREHVRTSEILALRGMVRARRGEKTEALDDFTKALPGLTKRSDSKRTALEKARLEIILEAYLDLLGQSHGRGNGGAVSEEAFRIAGILNRGSVEKALGQTGARAAARDPELAELVRREQDTSQQIRSLEQAFSNALNAPPGLQDEQAVRLLKTSIASLSEAQTVLREEITRRFPRYMNFIHPPSSSFEAVQESLRKDEALIAIHSTQKLSFVWGIPKEGDVVFQVVSLGREAVEEAVHSLRQSLDPDPGSFGDIPSFDLETAALLYEKLLKPAHGAWKGASDLLIVAHGALGRIPFGVLPTEPVTLDAREDLLFEAYRKVPWLIREVSITRLPSVSSLITLRSLPAGSADRKPFIGFGDPIFSLAQLSSEDARGASGPASRPGSPLRVRGIRKTAKKDATLEDQTSVQLIQLGRLPDTAEEVRGIAGMMGADPEGDVFLGRRASEQQVKKADLFDRNVIVFASHGLVPGDLDGLLQPAIALSSPDVVGDPGEDGLLKMDEILQLKLNADWVVLSACNTGAADGAGAEAVSGLGRAFFYAGSRALLVSMWSVETTSAKLLTTGLFQYQREDRSLSRARALQKSMIHVMDTQVLKEPESGQSVAACAHPFFWAPFVVVGDGGL